MLIEGHNLVPAPPPCCFAKGHTLHLHTLEGQAVRQWQVEAPVQAICRAAAGLWLGGGVEQVVVGLGNGACLMISTDQDSSRELWRHSEGIRWGGMTCSTVLIGARRWQGW